MKSPEKVQVQGSNALALEREDKRVIRVSSRKQSLLDAIVMEEIGRK